MGFSKERVEKILAVIEYKYKQCNCKDGLACAVRYKWILRFCENELQELLNIGVTPDWLNKNGYTARVAVKKALVEYKIIAWEQRWYR